MEAQVLGGLKDSRLFGRVSICICSQFKMKDEQNQLIHVVIDCKDHLCLFPGETFWHDKRLLKRKIIFLFTYFTYIVKIPFLLSCIAVHACRN